MASYRCTNCSEVGTSDQWTATTKQYAIDNDHGEEDSVFPAEWNMDNANPGDTVVCPNANCEWEFERSEIVPILDLSQFAGKHIIFMKGNRHETVTEVFVEANVPNAEYYWSDWQEDPELLSIHAPMAMDDDLSMADEVLNLLWEQQSSGNYGTTIVGRVGEHSNLVVSLETDKYIFLCIDGEEE